MEIIQQLEHSRQKYGYEDKEYQKYSKHISNLLRHLNKQKDSLTFKVFKTELYLIKHLIAPKESIRAKNYKKLLKSVEQLNDLKELQSYFSAKIYFINQEFTKCADELSFCTFYYKREVFSKEVDYILDVCSRNGAKIKEKVRVLWNDIELQFNDQEEVDEFFRYKVFIEKKGFDADLKNFILKIEKRKANLSKLFPKLRVKCLLEKSKKLFQKIEEFDKFLQKNYISSDYINELIADVQQVYRFFNGLNKLQRGNLEEEDFVLNFRIPNEFVSFEEEFKKMKDYELNMKEIKKQLFNFLDEKMKLKPSTINMPFLPVFYDLAYDYIGFESEKKGSFSDFFSKFSSFKLGNKK